MRTVAGVVLAGGQSSRMGQDKAQLIYEGETLLSRCVNRLMEAGCQKVHISHPEYIPDRHPNLGPLAGIYASMCQLQQYDALLFCPVDMPKLTQQILANLMQLYLHQHKHDVIYYQGEPLPLVIKNSQKNRAVILQKLNQKQDLSLRSLLNTLPSRSFRHQYKQQLISVNTPIEFSELTS